ncbi:MAG: hypothetical protein ACFBSD_02340 [Paracoccaceae bacterium]
MTGTHAAPASVRRLAMGASTAELAARLTRALGPGAAMRVQEWVEGEIDTVGDAAIAARFAGHFGRFDLPPAAYAPRLVVTERAAVLGGIRFKGGDPDRPFVDVTAHDGEIVAVAAVVAAEWRAFRPQALRILGPVAPPGPFVTDQSVHAAPVRAPAFRGRGLAARA